MAKVLEISKINKLPKDKTIVIVGGCFDILHKGHLEFIEKSKNLGDVLVILLESDERIKKTKGNTRPINSQKRRTEVLLNQKNIDYIIPLAHMESDSDYENLVKQIQPDIISVTSGTQIFDWEKEYVREKNGEIVEVMEKIPDYSTTELIKKL